MIGHRQLELLTILARPGTYLVSGESKRTFGLVRRGLCAADENGNGVTITANGLRALADAADAGRVDLRPSWKKEVEQ